MAAFCKKLLTTSGLVKQTPRYCSNSISALGSQNAHQDVIDANISPMSMEEIPFKRDYSQEKCDLRRSWVERYTGASLKNVSNWWKEDYSPDILKGNIEQPIGTIAMPLAVAGPLQINGEHANGKFLAPLSTTEGALVASISRGAVVLNQSGGVFTSTSQQRMTRCPVFTTDSPAEAVALGEWVKSKIACIQEEVVSKHSRHSKLKDVITVYDIKVCLLSHFLFFFNLIFLLYCLYYTFSDGQCKSKRPHPLPSRLTNSCTIQVNKSILKSAI